MKIAVISPNINNLQEMGRILGMHSHSATLVEGGKSRMRSVAELEQPDLMLVEGMCCDPTELAQVEYVTTHHPSIAVILLCATHTPEFLINSMRAGVREVLPSPVTASALEAAVSRIAAKRIGGHARALGRILAFMPCKGGSGATFLATNLGYQLAEAKSVLLIDLNLQFGEALSFVHDGTPTSTLADVARDISRLDATFLAASTVKVAPNYSILAAPEDPAQAMEMKPEHIDAILNLAVTQYDFILLDVGRTLDTLTIKALDRADRIFPVLQAGLPYIRNAKKLLTIFKSLGYPMNKVELIVNRYEKSGEVGIDNVRNSLGAVTLHTVPNSYKEVNASINHGDPMIEAARSNAVTKNLAAFALSLSPREEESRSLLGRLFRRA
ncbi:pilus assembly protein CpaE [Collimonas sp. OK242]|jgi:pilus assembly protein CpaE|uniref:AAA family ATPase n=1 Tax=Collimonas sp. OK242 TaxID=1798195 RepID=UPI0008965746|nr:AAA family ATPase [Collimonas sp. OK242]SDY55163.1 pilus assembly protein CpaE [Collimonas sp. OK242]